MLHWNFEWNFTVTLHGTLHDEMELYMELAPFNDKTQLINITYNSSVAQLSRSWTHNMWGPGSILAEGELFIFYLIFFSLLLSFFFLILFLFFYFFYLKYIFHDILLITLQHWQVSVAHWLGLRLACERSRVRIKAMSSTLKYRKQHSFFLLKKKFFTY